MNILSESIMAYILKMLDQLNDLKKTICKQDLNDFIEYKYFPKEWADNYITHLIKFKQHNVTPNVNHVNILRRHKIYNVEILRTGYILSKTFKVRISNISCNNILYTLHVIYTEQKLDNRCIYLTLCFLLYEFLPFDTFIEKFAMTKFMCLDKKMHAIIEELQKKYNETLDMKYIYMINIIIRGETVSFRKTLGFLQKCYNYNPPIKDFIDYTYTAYPTELSKTYYACKSKQFNKMEEAYDYIACITLNTHIYSLIMNDYARFIHKREIDMDLVTKAIIIGQFPFDKTALDIIHLANFKYQLKMNKQ